MVILRKLNLLQIKEINMNNIELYENFSRILSLENEFDKFLELKSLQKKYKKSVFYKKTHLSLWREYEWFAKNIIFTKIVHVRNLLTPEKVGEYITNTMDNITPDALEGFLEKITEVLDINQIADSAQELGDMIQSLQK